MNPQAQKPPIRLVEPCNFRSAGQLSNESARVLTTLFESLARNVMNTLDVYLGAALEVKPAGLRQLSIEEYKAQPHHADYVMPCSLSLAPSHMLIEIDGSLLFAMIDLLLGGSGTSPGSARELTDIDEEVLLGVAMLLAQQVERVWEPLGIGVRTSSRTRGSLAHKLFPPMEKVMTVRFETTVAGATGAIVLVFPAALGSHLVRNIKPDPATRGGSARYFPRLSLEERMLDCRFTVSGTLPEVRVPVRGLAALAPGEVFLLPALVDAPGRLRLEDQDYFEAAPVRSGNLKAVQLLAPLTRREKNPDDLS